MTARVAPIRHQPIADALRQSPNTWQLVRVYPSRGSAVSTARCIRTGWLVGYQPTGAFDAEIRTGSDSYEVWARYVGAPGATEVEQARRIAVALEQENARLHQVVAFLLTNPLQRMDMRVFTSDIDAMAGRVTITDLGSDRTKITYRWRGDVLAEPAGVERPL